MKLNELKGINEYHFTFMILGHKIREHEKKHLINSNSKITPLMLSYLIIIDKNPKLLNKDINELLGIAKGTASTMIKNLVEKKLLTNERSKEDSRVKDIKITAKGKTVVKIALDIEKRLKRIFSKYIPAIVLPRLLTDIQRI